MRYKDYEIAKSLTEKLSEVAKIVDFRIFGSRARGEDDDYSDMDVFIEVEDINEELRERIRNIVWEISFENCVLISPLIFTRKEIENSPLKSSPIIKNIMEEGIEIGG